MSKAFVLAFGILFKAADVFKEFFRDIEAVAVAAMAINSKL